MCRVRVTAHARTPGLGPALTRPAPVTVRQGTHEPTLASLATRRGGGTRDEARKCAAHARTGSNTRAGSRAGLPVRVEVRPGPVRAEPRPRSSSVDRDPRCRHGPAQVHQPAQDHPVVVGRHCHAESARQTTSTQAHALAHAGRRARAHVYKHTHTCAAHTQSRGRGFDPGRTRKNTPAHIGTRTHTHTHTQTQRHRHRLAGRCTHAHANARAHPRSLETASSIPARPHALPLSRVMDRP